MRPCHLDSGCRQTSAPWRPCLRCCVGGCHPTFCPRCLPYGIKQLCTLRVCPARLRCHSLRSMKPLRNQLTGKDVWAKSETIGRAFHALNQSHYICGAYLAVPCVDKRHLSLASEGCHKEAYTIEIWSMQVLLRSLRRAPLRLRMSGTSVRFSSWLSTSWSGVHAWLVSAHHFLPTASEQADRPMQA